MRSLPSGSGSNRRPWRATRTRPSTAGRWLLNTRSCASTRGRRRKRGSGYARAATTTLTIALRCRCWRRLSRTYCQTALIVSYPNPILPLRLEVFQVPVVLSHPTQPHVEHLDCAHAVIAASHHLALYGKVRVLPLAPLVCQVPLRTH